MTPVSGALASANNEEDLMIRKSLWFLAIACVYTVALGQSAHAFPTPPVPEIDPGSFGSAAALLLGSLALVERHARRLLIKD